METWDPTLLGQIKKPLEPDIPKQDINVTAFPFSCNYCLLVVHLISVSRWDHGNYVSACKWPSVCHSRSAPAPLCSSHTQETYGRSPSLGSFPSTQCQCGYLAVPEYALSPETIWTQSWVLLSIVNVCKLSPFGENEASLHLAGNAQKDFPAACLWKSDVLKSWKG